MFNDILKAEFSNMPLTVGITESISSRRVPSEFKELEKYIIDYYYTNSIKIECCIYLINQEDTPLSIIEVHIGLDRLINVLHSLENQRLLFSGYDIVIHIPSNKSSTVSIFKKEDTLKKHGIVIYSVPFDNVFYTVNKELKKIVKLEYKLSTVSKFIFKTRQDPTYRRLVDVLNFLEYEAFTVTSTDLTRDRFCVYTNKFTLKYILISGVNYISNAFKQSSSYIDTYIKYFSIYFTTNNNVVKETVSKLNNSLKKISTHIELITTTSMCDAVITCGCCNFKASYIHEAGNSYIRELFSAIDLSKLVFSRLYGSLNLRSAVIDVETISYNMCICKLSNLNGILHIGVSAQSSCTNLQSNGLLTKEDEDYRNVKLLDVIKFIDNDIFKLENEENLSYMESVLTLEEKPDIFLYCLSNHVYKALSINNTVLAVKDDQDNILTDIDNILLAVLYK